MPGALADHRPPGKLDRTQQASKRAVVGFDPISSRRIQEGTSATVDVFENADGSITRKVYPQPVNYRGHDGRWHPIDTRLRRGNGGRLQTTAGETTIIFAGARLPGAGGGVPAGVSAAPGEVSGADTAGELASITYPSGQVVAYGLGGAAAVEPSVSGSTALYSDILPHTDVELVAFDGGVKETLILKSAQAATEWVFPLTLRGLSPRLESDGTVSLVDAAGQRVSIIPRGSMRDSLADGSGEGAMSDAVRYELVTSAGALALRVIADPEWVRDPARIFPVFVDPTISPASNGSTFVQDPFTNNNSGSAELKTGYHSSGPYKARSFVKFDAFSTSYLGHRVQSAKMWVSVAWSGSCPSTRSSVLRVHDISSAWTTSGVTKWSNQPALGAELGNVTKVPNSTVCNNDPVNYSVGEWWGIPLWSNGVDVLNRWTSGGANNGLAIVADLTNNDTWKKISSVNTSRKPYLEITYTPNERPQVEAMYPPHGYASPTLTPELMVTATDPDSWPTPMKYRFQVFDTAGEVVADSGSTLIAARSWVVPTGVLEWGKTYVWAAAAYDGALPNAAFPAYTFTTAVPQPLITSGLSQNSSQHGFEPSIGNYTTQVTDANIATTGPALAIQRSYNSRDPRSGQAFGAGWSSLLDAKLTMAGNIAIVTYPSGQDVAFGLKADGTYAPPSGGLSSSLKPITDGYELIDKTATSYHFTWSDGGNVWRLTSIRDAQGRRLSLGAFVSGRPTQIQAASGRTLSLTWAQPAGASSSHVDTVSTELATPGQPGTENTWKYIYKGDRLVKVCPPTDWVNCTSYTYGGNSLYPTAVLDAHPHTYLRLGEPAGTAAATSSTVDSLEAGSGVYQGVTSVAAAGLPGSPVTAPVFDGISSRVDLGKSPTLSATYQSVSLRFRANSGGTGVLYSRSTSALGEAAAAFNPVLYVGTDHKLYAQFWTGAAEPIVSSGAVDDGNWHHVVLTSAGSTQTLYLDGQPVGEPKAGTLLDAGFKHSYLGAGMWQGWPSTTGDVSHFNGQLSDFAVYTKPLLAEQVAAMYQASQIASSPLERITRASGRVQAVIGYDTTSGLVRTVTDGNGGTWQLADATRSNSGQVYRSTILSRAPRDYFRLADTGPATAVNEVNGGVASYNLVTLGVDGGPLGDDLPVASFNGTSSYVRLPDQDLPKTGPASMSMWFRMPAGSTAGGVLWSYSSHTVEQASSAWGWIPGLYVGTDGKLRAQLYWTGSIQPVVVQSWVNDGNWHHVALTGSPADGRQNLYLDGVHVATLQAAIETDVTSQYTAGYLGAGKWATWPGIGAGEVGYWPGQIAEFAYFGAELNAGDVAAQFSSRTRGTSWLGMHPGAGGAAVGAASRIGQQCSDATAVTAAGDFSGDGKPDLVCRGTDSTLYLYRGNGSGGFIGGPIPFGWGFDGATKLMWPGDFSGDGKPDLVYRNSTTSHLIMLRGDGQGSWLDWQNVQVGSYWPTSVFTVGDFTGDGKPDFFYVDAADGKLWLWRGNGSGGWIDRILVDGSSDWRTRDQLGGRGDFDGDGKPDIMFRSVADKHLYLVRGNGSGGLISATPIKISDNHADKDAIVVAGDFTGDGKSDVVFRSTVDPDRPVTLSGVPTKIVNVTDPAGNQISNVYDLAAGGRQIEIVDARGKRTTFGYDTGGFVRTTTDPNKNQTISEHDSRGNVIAQISCQDASEIKCSTTHYEYYLNTSDPNDLRNDKLIKVRDGRSESSTDDRYLTTYTYDTAGNLIEIKDPLGRVKKHQLTGGNSIVADYADLSANGRYLRVYGTARGTQAGYSLWELEVYGNDCRNLAAGRPVTVSSVESGSVPGAHATDGSPFTQWGSVHSDPQWIYVDLGAAADIDRVRLEWESAFGLDYLIQVSNDAQTWTTVKTVTGQDGSPVPAGLTSQVISAGGAVQTNSYAANGDLVRTVDAAGLATCFARDGLGRVIEQAVSGDTYSRLVTTFGYDRLDRVVTMTEPETINRVTGAEHTRTITNVYDADGNIVSTTFGDLTGGDASRVVNIEYDAHGHKRSKSDAKNNKTFFEYDAFGRVTKQTTPDGTAVEIGYDQSGNQTTTRVNGQLIESNAYDDAGRLASVTDAMGWQTLYTYTDNNLLATATRKDPATAATYVTESNTYDAAGNLVSQATNNGATVTGIAVDAASRVASKTLDASGVNRTVSFVYGADDAVLSRTLSGPTGSQTVDAIYDPAGRMIWQGVRMPGGAGGPDGWWQLNETSGTAAADSSANGRTATASASVSWSDGAASLNGTDGRLATSAPVLDTTQSYTVSAWVKRAPSSGGDFCRTAVSQEAAVQSGFTLGTCGDRWEFGRSNTDTSNASSSYAQSTTPFTTNVWTHLVGVYDKNASTWKLYVNGVLQGTANVPAPFTASGPFLIGRGKYNSAAYGWFPGAVDNVQAYQRVLTSDDVAALHGGGRSGSAVSTSTISMSVTYDQFGNVTAQTDPNGHVTRYSYDEAGRPVQIETPTVTTEENDIATTAPIVSTTGYDAFGAVVEQRDGRGLVTRYERDANGQVVKAISPSYTVPGGSTPLAPVVEAVYDTMGRVSAVKDPLARQASYTYDHFGQVTSVTTPDMGVTTYEYHLDGEVKAVTDAGGARQEATHDYLGRPVTSTQLVRRDGQPTQALTTSYVYYGQTGWLEKVVSPDPARGSTRYEYNSAGEVIKAIDTVGNTTQFTYDFAGRETTVQLPDGSKKKAFFDAAGRPTSQQELSPTNAVLRTVSATYDNAGNVMTAKDARGIVRSFAYDPLGRLTQATQPVSGTESIVTTFGYDANGQRTRFTDGRGGKFLATYNTWNMLESEIDPGGHTFTAVYNLAGRVDKKLMPGAVSQTFSYDVMDNVTRVIGSGAEIATEDRVFGYDSVGRVTSLSGPGGTNTLAYDDRGLLTAVTGPSGDSSFAWTADGLMASRNDAAGTTAYTYDAAGRLKTAANATAGLEWTYDYNNLSQVSQITYGANQNRRVFSYDALHRLQTDELKTAAGASLGKITYGWDANDSVTSKTTVGFAGAGTNTYTYDLANRLTSWNSTTYAYDKSGNRIQAGGKTFAYDAANRLQSSSDGTTYEYTARGTLRRTTVGTVSLDTLSDAFDQVIRQYSTATQFSEYTYDGLGRVIQSGFAYTGTGNDLAKDPAATYVRDPGGGLLGSRSGSGVYAWTDLHQDVVGQFTATGSALSGSTTFEPFGKVSASAGMQGSLGYQSEWTDVQTGRVNMHARWYNPETGQFDSRDTVAQSPVPSSINANRFAYANANPLTGVDPTGHAREPGEGGGSPPPQPPDESQLPPCQRSAQWYYSHGTLPPTCVTSGGSTGWDESVGFNGRTGQTVNNCPHGNYDWIFPNCTGVGTYGDGTSCIGDKFDNRLCFTADQLAGLNPAILAAEVDKEVGRRGGYGDDARVAAVLTAVVLTQAISAAVERQAALDTKIEEAKCSADWWCANAGWIGAVAGAVAGVIAGGLCLAVTAGAGSILCAALAGFVGGFVGSLTTGLLEGREGWDLWGGALIDGAIGAVIGVLTLGAGAALGAGVRALLRTTAGNAIGTSISAGLRSAGSRLAATALGRGVTAARSVVTSAENKIGRCAVQMAGQSALAAGGALLTAHSFDPDTGVLMADGTVRPMDGVAVGDQVIATDPEAGATGPQVVTKLHANLDTDLVDVTVGDAPTLSTDEIAEGDGGRSTRGPTAMLQTTQHHPFWDATAKQWVNAAELRPGVSTLIGPDGQIQRVIAVQKVFGFKLMRDMTVANVHTYYVMAGETPVLVHNCGGGVKGHADSCTCGGNPNKEITIDVESFEQARNKGLELVGDINPATRVPVIGSLPKSAAFGRQVGFETRVDGIWKRFRIDYDPKKGTHVNVNVGKGRSWAIRFPGSESDFLGLLGGNT